MISKWNCENRGVPLLRHAQTVGNVGNGFIRSANTDSPRFIGTGEFICYLIQNSSTLSFSKMAASLAFTMSKSETASMISS